MQTDYLNEMGITLWYPRTILPNALAPLIVDLKAPIDSEQNSIKSAAIKLTTVALSDEQPDSNASQEVIDNKKQLEPVLRPVDAISSSDKSTKLSQSGSDEIRFGLGLYLIGNQLVLSSLTNKHDGHEKSALSLISNLLLSMTGQRFPVTHHHVIVWPFFTNSNANQNRGEAAEYVTNVVLHLKEQHEFSSVLCFGGVMANLYGWESASGHYMGLNRLVLPSVYKMLNEPNTKAKAWALIKKFNNHAPQS